MIMLCWEPLAAVGKDSCIPNSRAASAAGTNASTATTDPGVGPECARWCTGGPDDVALATPGADHAVLVFAPAGGPGLYAAQYLPYVDTGSHWYPQAS